ncbi:MAG: winged helix family transcriptional regulator [Phycisphaerales bacterium]|nr:MAG: winged helix family transcriptional regulator [Phycisphaerales bacterium]
MTLSVQKPGPHEVHYPDPDERTIGPIKISPRMREVRVDGLLIDLTRMQFDILMLLASRAGWVYSRDRIVQAICGPNHVLCSRAIDVHIVNIRKQLGNAGKYVQTVRGVGYRLRYE